MRVRPVLALSVLAVAVLARPVVAGDAPAAGYGYAGVLGAELDKQVGDALGRGKQFLLKGRDAETGAWDPKGQVPAGFTALATVAVIGATPRELVADDPVVAAALKFLATKQAANGSVFSNPRYVNYETSVAISAFAGARDKAFLDVIAKARDYVVASQIRGDEANPSYGGFPYESKSDPGAPADLSNAQFATEAAAAAGVDDKEFWGRVAAYLGRVQNRSETNRATVKLKVGDKEYDVVAGDDGGAGYGPGRSKAGYVDRADGKREPRSYGSMTYALLKCLLFAGVKADDARVEAAVAWISRSFTVERNPGFEASKDPAKDSQQGYYYYLLTMARALSQYEKATGKPLVVTDAEGKTHDWRREVAAKVVSLQKADGSWQNENERWEEALPLIATSYAMQTLAVCQGRL